MLGKRPAVLLLLGLVLAGARWSSAAAGGVEGTLGAPGYLIIEGARDSTAAFQWHDGPGPERHSLVWSQGTLSLPDTIGLEPFGARDGGLTCRAELSGVGSSGRLSFRDGIFKVSEPLLLADGILELHVSAGELEIRGGQIRYRRHEVPQTNTRADYIFLAGLVVLILVLMRRVRRGARKR